MGPEEYLRECEWWDVVKSHSALLRGCVKARQDGDYATQLLSRIWESSNGLGPCLTDTHHAIEITALLGGILPKNAAISCRPRS